ncbi:MAG: TonB-dependent receptor plug domain-containing protein [Rhodothermales bacterium]
MSGNTCFIHRFALGATVLFGLSGSVLPEAARAQEAASDSLRNYEMEAVVVTATRSPSVLRDVPVPTRVIPAEQIQARAALRLSDLLAEEPGMVLSHFLGTGIQLQGLDPAYTLILIDGEPVIGRNGGTLDLDRFTITDIASIEVVQGPSSSLYGSEALAGVINIRTRQPQEPFRALVGVRRQTHGTENLTASLEGMMGRYAWRLNADRLQSDGYDLHPEAPGLTGPGYETETYSSRFDVSLISGLSARINARFATEEQRNVRGFQQEGYAFTFEENEQRSDLSLSPSLIWQAGIGNTWTLRNHLSDYRTESLLSGGIDGREPEYSTFDQGIRKLELQNDQILGTWLLLNTGAGIQREIVEAGRIAGVTRSNRTSWLFSQQQFILSSTIDLTTSFRIDHHSDYGWQLSPKAGFMLKSRETVRFRASVGTGFKAPTFQQLYMDYTNPVAGYSVIGSADASALLSELESSGQIRSVMTDLAAFETVVPESSVSYNLSADTDWGPAVHLHVSGFRNHVRDLIETLPIAIKTNGMQVFSYVNLRRIVTQGLNAEISWRPSASSRLALGYQFLDTRDLDVIEGIDNGEYFGRQNGRDFRLGRSDYGGLFGRSRHTASLQFSADIPHSSADIHIRGALKSRYGFGDQNGNLILDTDQEYVDGHTLWNVTLNQPLSGFAQLQIGLVNALDHINANQIPSLSGRQVFAALTLNTR